MADKSRRLIALEALALVAGLAVAGLQLWSFVDRSEHFETLHITKFEELASDLNTQVVLSNRELLTALRGQSGETLIAGYIEIIGPTIKAGNLDDAIRRLMQFYADVVRCKNSWRCHAGDGLDGPIETFWLTYRHYIMREMQASHARNGQILADFTAGLTTGGAARP